MEKSALTRPRNQRLRAFAAHALVARDRVAADGCVQILDGFRAVVVGVADDLFDVTMPAVLSLALHGPPAELGTMPLVVLILHGKDYPNVNFSSERSWAGCGWRLPGRSGFRCGEKDIVLPGSHARYWIENRRFQMPGFAFRRLHLFVNDLDRPVTEATR